MNPLQRTGVAEKAAEMLAEEIVVGRLSGQLPPSRNLAALLRVSRPVVLQALHLLESRGLIAQTGRKRSYAVVVSNQSVSGRENPPSGERNALYILDQEVVGHDAFEILLSLAMRLHGKGWRFSTLRISYCHNENRPAQWQRAIEGYSPDRVMVWSGRPRLAEWLQKVGIPTLFMGGDSGETPMAKVGIDASKSIGRILDELFMLGHERIWLPMCNRPEQYSARVRESLASAFEVRGLSFSPQWHNTASPYRGSDVIVAMFEEAWSRFRPTALILHDWREYVAISSVLRRKGLDIPADISVALIGNDPEMGWHRPRLAHFEAPLARIVRACASWLLAEDSRLPLNHHLFEAEWFRGESIAAPWGDGAR